MKKPLMYDTRPENKIEATRRAKELKEFLREKLGGRWKIDVWENSGWHYRVLEGTISVSMTHIREFMVMNSGINGSVGTGDARLSSYYAKNPAGLVKQIKKSVKEFKTALEKYIKYYRSNSRIESYEEIEKLYTPTYHYNP